MLICKIAKHRIAEHNIELCSIRQSTSMTYQGRGIFFFELCSSFCCTQQFGIAKCGHTFSLTSFLQPISLYLFLSLTFSLSLSLSLSLSVSILLFSLFLFLPVSISSCLSLSLFLSLFHALFRYLTIMFRSSYNIGRRCQLFILIDVPLLLLKQNLSQKEFLKVVHNFFLCYFIFFYLEKYKIDDDMLHFSVIKMFYLINLVFRN